MQWKAEMSRMRAWMRTPPLMERTFGDDLKVAAAILLGGAIACLLGIASWTALLSAAVGVALATAAFNVIRRVRHRR